MTDILYRENRTSRRLRHRQAWPTGELIESRGVIATAIALTALAAAATAGGAVASGAIAAHAAGKAADKQTEAANHGADLQKQSTDEALAFQKQQAENEWLNSQNTQRANYDQSKARYGSIAGVASQYGLNLGAMPDYAPGIDPHYDTGATPTPPTGSIAGAAGASGNPTDPNYIAQQLQGVYKSLGVSPTGRGTGPTDIAYMADQVAKTGGWTPQNAAYWAGPSGRIASELAKSGGGSPAGSIAGAVKPLPSAAIAPTYSTPQVTTPIPLPYQPGSIGAARRY